MGDPVDGGVDDGVYPRFARAARFWLRAYPRRWREAHSAEILGVLADLARPGARRLDAHAAGEVVRAGWAMRWRHHPPLRAYLAYRVFDRKLPVQYRTWVHDDIEGALFGVRHAWGTNAVPTAIVAVAWTLSMSRAPWGVLTYVGLLAVSGVLSGRRRRATAARKQLVAEPGETVQPGSMLYALGPRVRVRALPALTALLVLVAVVAGAGTVAALTAPSRMGAVRCVPEPDYNCANYVATPIGSGRLVLVALLALGLVVGLALAPRARRRLRALAPARPDQPNRTLRTMSWGARIALGALGAAVVADAWVEGTGRVVVLAVAVTGPAALVALPAVVAVRRVVQHAPDRDALSWSDVTAMVLRGRRPAVDRLVEVVLPAETWLPRGSVVPELPSVAQAELAPRGRGLAASGG